MTTELKNLACRKCKGRIKKVKCGTLYCALTRPIRKVNIQGNAEAPSWCPKIST